MGNRALVQFIKPESKSEFTNHVEPADFSPVIYLHWAGQLEEAIKQTKELMKSRRADLSYIPARFVGVCHELIEGSLSLGMWNATGNLTHEDSHGDMGCILINVGTWEIEQTGHYIDCKLRLPETFKVTYSEAQ